MNFVTCYTKDFISELFVPYMDLTEEWYYRTFLDTGEHGFGLSAVPLEPLRDCPENAVYMDGYYAGQDGTPVKVANVFCVFERYAGDIMCESAFIGKLITEVRPEVNLVVRMVSTVGNYDYIIDWEFKQSGSIKVTIGLTGLLEVRGTSYTHKDQIEEDANSFVKTNLQTARVSDAKSPRKSYWMVVSETAKTEYDARIQLGSKPADLLVVNPNKKTKVGNSIGYRLIPGPRRGHYYRTMIMSRSVGGFSKYNVWVTPYNKSEKMGSRAIC